MEKRKPVLSRIFKSGRKQPKSPNNPSGRNQAGGTSSDPTLPNPQPLPETERSGPPSESTPAVSFPDGVEVLHDCPDAIVDICFVHGLTGNRNSTWTAPGQSRPWPKTLLPPKLSKARILTYGYDAYIVRKSVVSSNRLIDHATNLLNDLTTERACFNASSRALIFVAHSLGGLVCKETILLSRNNPEAHLRDIFNYTKGVLFMGTPHKGAWMADWAKIPASALGLVKNTNKSLLRILETDDQFLESIQVRFGSMIRELREAGRRLEVTCFFEQLSLPMVGKVVSKDSATLEPYSSFSINANHRDMVKFSSAEDNGFKRLLGELMRFKSQLVDNNSDDQSINKSGSWTNNFHIGSVGNQYIGQNQYFVHTLPEPSQPSQDCLKSLAFREMDNRSKDTNIVAAKGTCQWLLGHETYRSWAACDRGLLWIKGKPGSGKSTILRYALDNIIESLNIGDGAFVLSFFFHGRGAELQKTPLGLFRSFLHQVLSRVPNAVPDLVATFQQRRDDIGAPGEKWQWHLHELQYFFQSSLPKVLESRPIWLFVDALDECGEENAVDLVRQFKSLLRELSSNGSQFRICFTCRHYPILDLDYGFEICLEHENRQDISTYVQAQLSISRVLMTSMIQTIITDCASGVFMWAHLIVMRVLQLERRGVGLKKIEAEIRSIPPDLDNLYHELVQGMDERPASLKLIQFICFATRPLSLDELRWVMVVNSDPPYRSLQECRSAEDYACNCDEACNCGRMERRLKTLTRGLAETIPPSNTLVQFIHQSVQDFFVEKGLSILECGLKSTEAEGADFVGIAHYRLSRTCIRYLAMEEIAQSTIYDRDGLMSAFPLLNYATTSWVSHVKQSEARKVSQDDLLDYFFWPSEALVQLWVRIYNIIERFSHDSPQEGTSMVHIVSRYRLIGPLQVILQRADQLSTNIDAKDNSGQTPLSWAAVNGHEVVVKLLLDTDKVDAESKDNYGQTPLSKAAETGRQAIVKLLLATDKVDAESKDNYGQTPLSKAAETGRQAIVKLLLATDKVDAESKDNSGRTPLSKAAEYGHQNVVKLLLATNKVDAKSADNQRQTPLSRAAMNGHEAIVKLFLEYGVDVDSKTANSFTTLNWAAWNGCESVVKLLLEKGADVDLADDKGRTPLSWAARHGKEAVVKLLLAVDGVDVDSRDTENGQTPLSWAAQSGHEAAVKLLLAMDGVDVDSRDTKYGQTPLSWAAWYGHEAVIKLLLAKDGVNADSLDKDGGTPLSRAADTGQITVVKLLLATGRVDPAHQDKYGRTPLWSAAWSGQEAVVQLLLAQDGVDPFSDGKYNRSPLSAAAEQGHDTVMQLLLAADSHDADSKYTASQHALLSSAATGRDTAVRLLLAKNSIDPDFKGRDGRTPLSLAAANGHGLVVQQLLGTEAINPNCKDKDGRTPLSWAADNGHHTIVGILLATDGVNQSKDNYGRTPLFWAIRNRHEEVAKLLLANDYIDSDCKDTNDGRTPLSWAAQHGLHGVVRLLLSEDGVNVDSKDQNGQTPLSWAAWNGCDVVVRLLLAINNVDPDSKDECGRTPLAFAARSGCDVVVRLLLATDKVDPDSKDDYGLTPLSLAASEGHEAVVRLLLGTGADVESNNSNDRTPLSWAACKGHEAVVRLLLDLGADVESKDRNGRTPLSWAAGEGHEAVVRLLLGTDKVDPDCKDEDGWTPLMWATWKGHEAVVKALLDRGADTQSKTNSGISSLSCAAENGHEAVLQLLLEKDINPDVKDETGFTPLMLAALNGHVAVMQLLLAKVGVNLNSTDNKYGRTPLFWAAKNGHDLGLRLLLSTDGVDVDSPDKFGQTPLYIAAWKGHESTIRLLLATGHVDVNSQDIFNTTPLLAASRNGQETVVKLLLENEAIDVACPDIFGRTPLSWAVKRWYFTIVDLLLEEYENRGISIRDGELHIATSAPADDTGRILCDVCLSQIPNFLAHYNCRICIDGDFNICEECVKIGAHCLEISHRVVRRMITDGIAVEDPDPESLTADYHIGEHNT